MTVERDGGGPRRRLEIALGLLWLLDGLLQSQSSMFSADFFGSMLRMSPVEPPGWLWDFETHFEPFVTAHSWGTNATAAIAQLAIGAGICWRRSAPFALVASIPWALGVWAIGEAFGGLFGPGANLATDAPGPALLYAALAAILLLARMSSARAALFGRLCWSAYWCGGALLETEALNRSPSYIGATIAASAQDLPRWLAPLSSGAGSLIGSHGATFALVIGLAEFSIGVAVWRRGTRPAALVLGTALGVAFGVAGQGLGSVLSKGVTGVFESGATDPGIAPIMVLLACAVARRGGVGAAWATIRRRVATSTVRSRPPAHARSHAPAGMTR